MFRNSLLFVAVLLVPLLAPSACRAADDGPFFETDVRPILKANCFHCHGEDDELAGGLDVRLKRFLKAGGDSGPAIDSQNVAASLLLSRVRSGEMPPESVEKKLTADEIDTIQRWLLAGAKTRRPEPQELGRGFHVTEEEKSHWAFQPIRPVQPPTVRDLSRVRSPIDRFVLARLEQQGLTFAPDADPATLLRRACFDLIGLPPSPDEADAFCNDDSPDALAKLTDRLLASPRYGERWGRHWLDVAGYADSEGHNDQDVERPNAWRYRDYVIRAFNSGKPFDQFIVQQLAGDELVADRDGKLSPDDVENLIATGFLRMAPDGTAASGVDVKAASNENIADTLKIVSTSLLGLTVGCAQCHNHRYDPIPQSDYYRFRAIFAPALDWHAWRTPAQRRVSLYTDADRQRAAEIETAAKQIDQNRLKQQAKFIEQVFERELAKLPAGLQPTVRAARDTPDAKRSAAQKKLLKEHPSVNVSAGSLYLYDRKAADELKSIAAKAAKVRATKPKESFLRALTEPVEADPPATFVFLRGDHEQPADEVPAAELTVLNASDDLIPANDPELSTTGRRLAYARWLTGGSHPLTARVIVNRIWMHHFGRGLVATAGDFGALGESPSHPELLDWLANEFMMSGWNAKHLHRLILTSTVWQQASRRREQGEQIDADNRLLWHMPVRRLEAETLRDSMLAVTGAIVLKPFGPPVPVMADRVGQFVIGKENLNAGRPGADIDMKGEDLRRSIYVQVRRSRPLSVLDTFDAPVMTPNCTLRASSTVAPQSLMLMNSVATRTHAGKLAERVRDRAGETIAARIRLAWKLAYAVEPADDELAQASQFVQTMTEWYRDNPAGGKTKPAPEDEAMTTFCQALISSNRFLYID